MPLFFILKTKFLRVQEIFLQNLSLVLFLGIPFFALVLVAEQSRTPSEKELKQFFSEKWKLEIGTGDNLELFRGVYYWYGTPHQDNGKDESGIDCSTLASKLVQRAYSQKISGPSESIATQVKTISQTELKEGDLLFFNIYGKKISHVGVYLKDRKFAHASVTKGVTVNSLDEEYYKTRFVSAGRL